MVGLPITTIGWAYKSYLASKGYLVTIYMLGGSTLPLGQSSTYIAPTVTESIIIELRYVIGGL